MVLNAILSIAEIVSKSKDPRSPQPQCSVALLPLMKTTKISFINPATGYAVCFSGLGSANYAGIIDYEDSGDKKGKLLDSIIVIISLVPDCMLLVPRSDLSLL